MDRHLLLPMSILVLICWAHAADATSWIPTQDNGIVALDLMTGQVLWRHTASKLGTARLEVYKEGLVVYPDPNREQKPERVFTLNLTTGEKIANLQTNGKTPLTESATFRVPPDRSLDNGWVASGINSATIQFIDPTSGSTKVVWEIDTGDYVHAIKFWKDMVFCAHSYMSDDGFLFAYKAGGDTPLWKVDLNSIVKGREHPLTRLVFQVIDHVLYVQAKEHIFSFDPLTGALNWHRNVARELGLRLRGDLFGGALNVAVFAKEKDVLVISFELRVLALDLKTNKYLWQFNLGTFPNTSYPVIYHGRVFLTMGLPRRGKELPSLKGHTRQVMTFDFSPDGRRLVSGSGDTTVRIWDIASRSEWATLHGHTSSVNEVAFAPDGKSIASVGSDGVIQLWDAERKWRIRSFTGTLEFVKSVAFSHSGKRLASGNLWGTVFVWEVATGQHEILKCEGTSVAFSPDDKLLAAGGSDDSFILIWNLDTLQQLRKLEGHTNAVTDVTDG